MGDDEVTGKSTCGRPQPLAGVSSPPLEGPLSPATLSGGHDGWGHHLLQDQANHPEEAEDDVLGHGQVVVLGAVEESLTVYMICRLHYDPLCASVSFFLNLQSHIVPGVDGFLPQQGLLPRVGSEEPPVHPEAKQCRMYSRIVDGPPGGNCCWLLEVPGESVEGGDGLGDKVAAIQDLEGRWAEIGGG